MARTVKVMKEKAAKERAREADDKKLVAMRKLREENQKRAQRIKGRKERQLKIVKEERIEKKEKDTERDASPQRNSEVSKRGRFIDLEVAVPKTG